MSRAKPPTMPVGLKQLAFLISPCGSASNSEANHMPQSEAEWRAVLQLAQRHRVVAAVANATTRANLLLPADVARACQESKLSATKQELAAHATTAAAVAAFAEASVPLLVLKGVPLSLQLHQRLGLRQSRDIDLLVRAEDVDQAIAILSDLGFRPRPQDSIIDRTRQKDIELLSDARQQIIELHWRLFDNEALHPPVDPQDDSCTRSGPQVARNSYPRVLTDEANLRYLAIHGAMHGWSRLKWLWDFAGLAASKPQSEIEALYQSTATVEGRRCLGQALMLCHWLFSLPLHQDFRRAINQDWRTRRLAQLGLKCMAAGIEEELEDTPLGTTLKNASHYLISSNTRYLWRELTFDMTDTSRLPTHSPLRRLGPIGRIAGWIGRVAAATRKT